MAAVLYPDNITHGTPAEGEKRSGAQGNILTAGAHTPLTAVSVAVQED